MRQRRSWLKRLCAPAIRRGRGLGHDEDGAVAIEFAFLALPFFGLIFAIMETAIVFLAGQIFDSAVNDASRLIRTGQTEDFTDVEFRNAVCGRLYGLFDCSKIAVNVKTITQFQNVDVQSPVNPLCATEPSPENCGLVIDTEFDGGARLNIVQVQVYYQWPTLINIPGFNPATQTGNTRLMAAVRVFKNEPF